MASSAMLKPPRPPHGQRLLIPLIDEVALKEPDRPWLAVPVNDSDPSEGYRDINFRQFANGINHATRWLKDNLNLPSEGFPAFAYAGLADHRYALFAVAAGKLGYQMIFPGPRITAAAQQCILAQKGCAVYLHTHSSKPAVDDLRKAMPNVRSVLAPDLEELMIEEMIEPVAYKKSWQEGRRDPWLVFHTSGTTGFPKTMTYSQQMFSMIDVVVGLDDIEETHTHHYMGSRIYLPIPLMHYFGMLMCLASTLYTWSVPVLGPVGKPPIPSVIKDIMKYTHVDGAVLVPAQIDALCRDPESLELLRKLKFVHFAGAPLSVSSGKLLSPYVRVVPAIGSTDSGGYFVSLPNVTEDWDYVSFQPHAGAKMEHRSDNMHELVFIRDPQCAVQPVFEQYPHSNRFETKDLWLEHPTKKGQWKIVGRTDDFVWLANGDGLYVAPLEPLIAEHPLVQNAFIGGQARAKAIVLVELVGSARGQAFTADGRANLIDSLSPYIEKVNSQCHTSAQLDPRLIVFTSDERPLPRTVKDTVSRSQALQLYEDLIGELYEQTGL